MDLQKQIVIDNLHYIHLHMILEYAEEDPNEIERALRNKKVIELAKKTIEASMSKD